MWDEDPKYQSSNLRLLVWTVLFALLVDPLIAWWTDDWSFYRNLLRILAAVIGALCIYTLSVWTVTNAIAGLARLCKRSFKEKRGG
jgi:hypothetical protein